MNAGEFAVFLQQHERDDLRQQAIFDVDASKTWAARGARDEKPQSAIRQTASRRCTNESRIGAPSISCHREYHVETPAYLTAFQRVKI